MTDLHLTLQQKRVFDLKREGLTSQQVADILQISKRTVHFHVRDMLLTFGANNFVHLERIIERTNPPTYNLLNGEHIEHEPFHNSVELASGYHRGLFPDKGEIRPNTNPF